MQATIFVNLFVKKMNFDPFSLRVLSLYIIITVLVRILLDLPAKSLSKIPPFSLYKTFLILVLCFSLFCVAHRVILLYSEICVQNYQKIPSENTCFFAGKSKNLYREISPLISKRDTAFAVSLTGFHIKSSSESILFHSVQFTIQRIL